MKQLALLAIWLALPMFGMSQEQSLADLARKTREAKKSTNVVDNIDVLNQTHLKADPKAAKVTLESTEFVHEDLKDVSKDSITNTVSSAPAATTAKPKQKEPLDSGFGKTKTIGTYRVGQQGASKQ